ncbi:MAG: hypothetical protein U1E22_03770 [Coriobacteriia bacterium]|nr:hypothetical protein [Coriobacteriia bacterium]
MPECAFHPGVETEVRCMECDRPICPKDMRSTPVGYKCPECARPARSQYVVVKRGQLLKAAGAALGAGLAGGLLLGFGVGAIGFFFWFIMFGYGAVVGEVARRASGGHREPAIAAVAAAGVVVGALIGGFGLFEIGLAVAGAVFYVIGRS